MEIQLFEDRLSNLINRYDPQELYWQLNADLNILRMHGSESVATSCDDLLKALLQRDFAIGWERYPPDVAAYYDSWKTLQSNGVAYGWDERVTGEERLMIMIIAKLTQTLIQQLRAEIYGTSIGRLSVPDGKDHGFSVPFHSA
jgi:hypothetical protein